MYYSDVVRKILVIFFLDNVVGGRDDITTERLNQMQKLMNTSAKACDDFYEYACGNYGTLHPIPAYSGRLDYLQMVSERNYELLDGFLKENLEESLQSSNPSAIDKAKVFYASCLDVAAVNKRGVQPLLQLLDSLGGWPILNSTWSSENFDWLQFVIDVQLSIGENFLIYVGAFRDILNGTDYILPTLDKPDIFILDRHNLTLYSNKIRATLEKFNVSESDSISATSEITEFYEELTNITESMTDKTVVITNIIDFQKELPGINLTKFLSTVYNTSFLPTDKFSCLNVPYMSALSTLLAGKDPKTIVNYVLWNVVDRLLTAVSEDFVQIVNDYNEIVRGFESPPPRWRACIDIIIQPDVMNTATASLFINRIFPKDNANEITQDMLRVMKNIKSTVRKYLKDAKWPAEDLRNKMIKKLNHLQLNTEDANRSETAINEEFQLAEVNYDTFFESYLNLKRLATAKAIRIYRSQSQEIQYNQPLVNADITNHIFNNSMVLHPGLLLQPIYHKKFPKFLKYGGLGMIIAHEIFRGFDLQGSFTDFQGRLKPWWNKTEWDDYNQKIECHISQYDNYDIWGQPVTFVADSLFEIVNDNMALKFAYMSYTNWLQKKPEAIKNEVIDGIEFTNSQLFFISAAQLHCSTIKKNAVDYEFLNNPNIPDKYRVIGMIVNSEEFADAFQCDETSSMNPSNKCYLY